MTQIEEAYDSYLAMLQQMEKIEKEMEPLFDYSPFSHIAYKLKGEVLDIRKKLIEHTVASLTKRYTPNIKHEADFNKIMTEAVGELEFRECIIESWFKEFVEDNEQLRKESLDQVLKLARSFCPFGDKYRKNKDWGRCDDWTLIVDKEVLNLHCYTWNGASSYSPGTLNYSINSRGEWNAFEKLVEIVVLGKNPVTAKGAGWLVGHYGRYRKDPEHFYGKHEVDSPVITAFQFFKNGKVKIWFSRPQYAEDVATVLTGENNVDHDMQRLV